tara:strand:+ start:1821 stop:2072 length:252 start_codon:yes stop_codon:yes gene_type:complete
MVFLFGLLTILSVASYDQSDWKYVGYHECKQIGTVEPGKARVYPLSVDDNHYILFKQKNHDGTFTVTCVNDVPNDKLIFKLNK